MPYVTQHAVRDEDYWQSHLQRLYAIMQTMSDQPSQDLRLRADLEREAGLVHAYIGQNGDANLVASCEYGAALALMRTLQKRGDGFQVEIRQEEQTVVLKGESRLAFGWPNWLDSYALAVLLDHRDGQTILSTADCIDACALPPENVDRFWPFLCSAYVTIAIKDPLSADLVNDAEGFMKDVHVMDGALVDGCYRPLLKVMRAIIDGNQRGFTVAIKQALHAFHEYFSGLENGDAEVSGLYHLPLAALVELGKRAGLRLTVKSDAISALSRNPEETRVRQVVARYPLLAIFDALEAAWFLEWEGFKENKNTHIYQNDKTLFASYSSINGPGIPRAEIDFELLQDKENPYSSTHARPALDVGQLLSIAESLASNPVESEAGEEVYLLEEAIMATDLALKYIECMGGVFDPDTLHSHAGQSLYEQEPGRFDMARLTVYRNALVGQSGDSDASREVAVPDTLRDEATTREQVFAMIEELKPFLLPILQALAVDTSGEVIKSLEPLPDDYEKVFDMELAGIAKKHYAEWWKHRDLHVGADDNTRIDAHMSPAGMLGEENELSYYFPGGYRSIAAYLNPHRIWTSWKYYQEGESAGLSMNGLVWVDDHWAWFPKPYKLLQYIEADGSVNQTRH